MIFYSFWFYKSLVHMQQVLGQLTEKSVLKIIWRIIFLTWLDVKAVVLVCCVFSVPAPSLQLLEKHFESEIPELQSFSLESKSLVPLLARHSSLAFFVMVEDGKIKGQACSLLEPQYSWSKLLSLQRNACFSLTCSDSSSSGIEGNGNHQVNQEV